MGSVFTFTTPGTNGRSLDSLCRLVGVTSGDLAGGVVLATGDLATGDLGGVAECVGEAMMRVGEVAELIPAVMTNSTGSGLILVLSAATVGVGG